MTPSTRIGFSDSYSCMSEPQIPQYATRSFTSPAASSASASSTISIFLDALSAAAFIYNPSLLSQRHRRNRHTQHHLPCQLVVRIPQNDVLRSRVHVAEAALQHA